MFSRSESTSSTDRSENFSPLYTGQKAHRFHGQFLDTLTSKEPASEGGRMGPCSNPMPIMSAPPIRGRCRFA
jgi:hypothetical protein